MNKSIYILFKTNNCDLCGYYQDCQEHTLYCYPITQIVPKDEDIHYKQIFGSVEEQMKVTKMFMKMNKVRKQLLEERDAYQGGSNTGPNVVAVITKPC